jgi:hypothetical protein
MENNMNQDFTNFVEARGLDLQSSGSGEKGFSEIEALELLNLMQKNEIELLGIEVWYRKKDGKIKIDSLSSWVPSNNLNTSSTFEEAREVIELACKTAGSIFTLQY